MQLQTENPHSFARNGSRGSAKQERAIEQLNNLAKASKEDAFTRQALLQTNLDPINSSPTESWTQLRSNRNHVFWELGYRLRTRVEVLKA